MTSRAVSGKTVLVTGGSSGIGAALAKAMAEAGATVGICARRKASLEGVLADLRRSSPESRMWEVDLSKLDEVGDFARKADDEMGGIDVLVNNAGVPKRRHVLGLTPDVVESVMGINYFSPVRLTLALLPRMLERGEGRIVNISSVAARLGPPHEAAYAASKGALTLWSESMAVDLGDTPVKVHTVNPGVVDTELFHLPDNEPPIAALEPIPPRELADAILRQLDAGTFELYYPEWFADLAAGRSKDVGTFLAGTVEWVRSQQQPSP